MSTTTSSIRVDESLTNGGVVEHVGNLKQLLGLLGFERREALVEFVRGLVEFGRSFGTKDLPTLHTERRVTLVFTAACGALNWGNILGFFFRHVDAVEPSEFAVGIFAEHRNVPGGHAVPSYPAVVILDVGLIEVAIGEERGTRLAEVGESDWLGNAGAVGRLVENLRHHPIGNRLGLGDFRPQRHVGIVGRWVRVDPRADMGDRLRKQHSSATLLPLDSNLQSVAVIANIADSEVFELTTTQPCVKLQGDHSRVAGVVGGVDHGLHVFLESEHVSGVRRRVVIRRCTSRNPRETLGEATRCGVNTLASFGDTLAEHAKCDSVISVRFFLVVLGINPRDNSFGCVTVGECLGERTAIESLSDDHAVPEQFQMALVSVLLCEQLKPVAEREQCLTVGLGDSTRPFSLKIDEVTTNVSA